MNSIRHLADTDFELKAGKKGRVLCTNIKGISVVQFHHPSCQNCKTLFPIFNALSKQINNCLFCAVNIGTYRSIVDASTQTISPITAVPLIILYVNGRPFLKYDGNHDIQSIGNFIVNVIKKLKESNMGQNSQIEVDNVVETVNGVIPFNIVCDGELCYLTHKEIYTSNNSNTSNRYSGNDPRNSNIRINGQQSYGNQSSNTREALSGAYNPQVEKKRNDLSQYSGM